MLRGKAARRRRPRRVQRNLLILKGSNQKPMEPSFRRSRRMLKWKIWRAWRRKIERDQAHQIALEVEMMTDTDLARRWTRMSLTATSTSLIMRRRQLSSELETRPAKLRQGSDQPDSTVRRSILMYFRSNSQPWLTRPSSPLVMLPSVRTAELL